MQHMRQPDLMPNEKEAVAIGGEAAGAYLDRIGRTDLATLTGAQWAEFCGTLFKAACEAMRKAADDAVPF